MSTPARASSPVPRQCCAGWWLTGLVFLFAERENRSVRFHAAQSVVIFGALSVVLLTMGGASALALLVPGRAFQMIQGADNLIWLGAVVLWVILLARTWRGDTWRVPFVAGLAQRISR